MERVVKVTRDWWIEVNQWVAGILGQLQNAYRKVNFKYKPKYS